MQISTDILSFGKVQEVASYIRHGEGSKCMAT